MSRHASVKSFPAEKPKTRTYSVMPARAIQDDSLHRTTIRVLGAICIHTNAHGIAWPSLLTLARHVHMRPETVSRHVRRLINKGYVRKLERKAYPMHIKRKSRGITNRYQVLFKGHDPLPTREQFESPIPKVVQDPVESDSKPDVTDQTGKHKRPGGPGDGDRSVEVMANTFKRTVEQTTGQPRIADQSMATARDLVAKGVTGDQVAEATRAMCKDAVKHGRPIPKALNQVARWAGL